MRREGHGLPVRQRNANASWIAFHGERGAVALVSNGLKSVHGPATGVVTFNEAGTPTLAGKGFKMLVEPAASAGVATAILAPALRGGRLG